MLYETFFSFSGLVECISFLGRGYDIWYSRLCSSGPLSSANIRCSRRPIKINIEVPGTEFVATHMIFTSSMVTSGGMFAMWTTVLATCSTPIVGSAKMLPLGCNAPTMICLSDISVFALPWWTQHSDWLELVDVTSDGTLTDVKLRASNAERASFECNALCESCYRVLGASVRRGIGPWNMRRERPVVYYST